MAFGKVISLAPVVAAQIVGFFNRVIVPLLAVDRRADTVVVADAVAEFGQEAVVFVFGRVGNAAGGTADIRAAARTFHRIAAVARAFGFMAA